MIQITFQDYIENMEAHRDNKRHTEWNLEATAELLQKRFKNSHVWVMRPSKMQFKTFSVYSNFVTSNDIGCPDHKSGQKSWEHLSQLFINGVKSLNGDSKSADTMLNLPITLVGFSKGCVVLNQLLYDLEDAKMKDDLLTFVERLDSIYWLDGGHSGGIQTWIEDEKVLKSLIGTNIVVHAHVTPYQVKDQMRNWIGKEYKKFTARLQRLGVELKKTLHFEEEERSLENHFNVLKVF